MAAFLQTILDWFFYTRQYIVVFLAFVTLRVYGKEVTFSEVKSRTFANRTPSPLNLDAAEDIDTLLEITKEAVSNAEKRRGVVTDKCKMLLTFGSLLFAVIGLLLPKYLAFDSVLMRVMAVIAVSILFNAIIILLFFFDVGNEMEISLEQADIQLDEKNLKKSLLNSRLQCCAASENRTDCLADIYLAARFCILTAIVVVAVLVLGSLIMNVPSDQVERIVREVRSDSKLTNLLQGPMGPGGQKGDQGDQGSTGQKGEMGIKGERGTDANVDEIVTRILADDRLRISIEKAVAEKK